VGTPHTKPTPAHDPANSALLERRLAGVTFPAWSKKFGWHAEGARTDRLDGRRAETVFYTHHGHRIGYTVISGDPLGPPDGAETVRRNGVEIHRYKDGDPHGDHVRAWRAHLHPVRPRHPRGYAAQARRLEGQRRGSLLTTE
jgi:hypothetical protein